MNDEVAKIYVYVLKYHYIITSQEVFSNIFKIQIWNPEKLGDVIDAAKTFGLDRDEEFINMNISPTREYILKPEGVESKYGNVMQLVSASGGIIKI